MKVKEPVASEYPLLRPGLILFTYLHLAADEPLTRALVDSGIAGVAYETVETDDRRLPLLAPMSEVAGRMAAQVGAYYLERPNGGRGLLLGGVPGVAPGKVVVIGGGIVGNNAAMIAVGLGAQVTILERSVDRMRHLEETLHGRVSLVCRRRPDRGGGARRGRRDRRRAHPRRARRRSWSRGRWSRGMKKGSVFVDVAIDQGGCAETSQADDARRPRLRGRRRHPLLRRQHAGRRADHLDEGAHERDAAVRRGDRRSRARGAVARDHALARGVNVIDGLDHVRGGRRSARPGVLAARRRARSAV